MKFFLFTAFLISSIVSFGQISGPLQRAVASQPVMDSRLKINLNFAGPHYADTTSANLSLGLDSIGSQITTGSHPITFWIRDTLANGTHYWAQVQGTGGGSGNPNTKIGAGYWQVDGSTNNVKTLFGSSYFSIDSSSNANALTFKIDTNSIHSDAYNQVHYWQGTQPMTIVGDMIYENATPTPVRLPGNTTSTLKILTETGTGAAANPPVWYVPVSSDVISWLGFTPYNSTNPSGYITLADLPTLNFVDGLHARDSAHAALGGKLDTAITTINGRNLYALVLDSMQAGTNRGFKVNFGSDAGWDILVRDSATGFLTNVHKGSVGQVLTMLGTGGIGWAAQAGGGSSTLTRQNITSGTSGTVTGGNYLVTIDPAATISTYTLTMPPSPTDQQVVIIEAGGTITSGVVISSFTLSANTGQTFLQNTSPNGSMVVGGVGKWSYRQSTSQWVREY